MTDNILMQELDPDTLSRQVAIVKRLYTAVKDGEWECVDSAFNDFSEAFGESSAAIVFHEFYQHFPGFSAYVDSLVPAAIEKMEQDV
jgi:hypothetical protein